MVVADTVERFRETLCAAGLEDTVVELDGNARTAEQAAAALGCRTGEIVKSLVFAGPDGEPLLVLAAGDGRVGEDAVGARVGGPVRLATPDLVRSATGFAIGGVPPFGHARTLPTLIDRRLQRWETVWAAAGTPRAVFSLPLESLIHITAGQLADVD